MILEAFAIANFLFLVEKQDDYSYKLNVKVCRYFPCYSLFGGLTYSDSKLTFTYEIHTQSVVEQNQRSSNIWLYAKNRCLSS